MAFMKTTLINLFIQIIITIRKPLMCQRLLLLLLSSSERSIHHFGKKERHKEEEKNLKELREKTTNDREERNEGEGVRSVRNYKIYFIQTSNAQHIKNI